MERLILDDGGCVLEAFAKKLVDCDSSIVYMEDLQVVAESLSEERKRNVMKVLAPLMLSLVDQRRGAVVAESVAALMVSPSAEVLLCGLGFEGRLRCAVLLGHVGGFRLAVV